MLLTQGPDYKAATSRCRKGATLKRAHQPHSLCAHEDRSQKPDKAQKPYRSGAVQGNSRLLRHGTPLSGLTYSGIGWASARRHRLLIQAFQMREQLRAAALNPLLAAGLKQQPESARFLLSTCLLNNEQDTQMTCAFYRTASASKQAMTWAQMGRYAALNRACACV